MPERFSETVLVHVYRGEVARSDTWRTRLDNTTNWALTVAAAVTTFAFASPQASHMILILGGFLVWGFLVIEARRYRYYDLWIRRVRLLEDGFVSAALRQEPFDADALRELATLMTRPRLYVSLWDALGLRLRRTYAPILAVLTIAWVMKIVIHPRTATSFAEVLEHAHVGPVPGGLVLAVAAATFVTGLFLYLRTFVRPLPSGELHARRRPRRPLASVFRMSR
jgi:uncharacterized membrane protein